jgi:hypothetical protein
VGRACSANGEKGHAYRILLAKAEGQGVGFILFFVICQDMVIWPQTKQNFKDKPVEYPYAQIHWVSEFCPSSGNLTTRKNKVSDTGSLSVLRRGEGDTYSVGPLSKN